MKAKHPPDGLHLLLQRRSLGIKHLCEPGPSPEQLQWMAAAALRAPDHAELVPFRFVVVQGPARARLADLFAEYARRKGKDADGVALERERALRAPVTVAVLARLNPEQPTVPEHEQWICVGGAVTNLLNAAHALGFAGKMLSGDKARAPHIAQAFCEPGETLVGWVALGTPARELAGSAAKDNTQVLRFW